MNIDKCKDFKMSFYVYLEKEQTNNSFRLNIWIGANADFKNIYLLIRSVVEQL